MPTARLVLAWLLLLVPALVFAQPDPPALPREVQPGISAERARQLLGSPARISRQVLLLRSVEQWHYGPPHLVRLTFEQPRGHKATLKSIRPLAAPPR